MIADALPTDAPVIVARAPAVEWPESLEQALHGLPKRWLFRNDRVSVLLAGLQRDELLALGPWPQSCLLVVTFGELHVVTAGNEFRLQETDSLVVVAGVRHELYAPEAADFLLLNLTPPPASANLWVCHGTVGRRDLLTAAAQLFGIHARV